MLQAFENLINDQQFIACYIEDMNRMKVRIISKRILSKIIKDPFSAVYK